ncbi:hypothetical protein P0W64_19510 [Tsukamurella sp. 8F]|uniref:hypothetical protein n=1 Tax=unclassified Tsukamurella TaxID=2633480 RepID=UPI0023B9E1FB|nr:MULTISPECIES: hypothetical protein [unclassified Tsukamurella]MDF0531729.1 hypothetical protein [Tsukamurella sp. 8J]MDF0588975.1 hypothetical protein [Tsukamurella sp. 8F]
MNRLPIVIARRHERAGALAALAHVGTALVAHFAVPPGLDTRLGLVADPWFRRETGTANAGYAYGAIRVYRGDRDATFLRATAIAGLAMAGVRSVATLRGERRGVLSGAVIASDLALGLGALGLAHLIDREHDGARSRLQRFVTTPALLRLHEESLN